MRSTMTGTAAGPDAGSPAPWLTEGWRPGFRTRPFPTSEEIDRHVRNGRRLRAEATASALLGLWRWLRLGAGPAGARPLDAQPGATMPAGEAAFPEGATPLRSPLMAIRSSAEILRDNPDLTPDQRARFVAILIDEERRLEWLIARAFGLTAPGG